MTLRFASETLRDDDQVPLIPPPLYLTTVMCNDVCISPALIFVDIFCGHGGGRGEGCADGCGAKWAGTSVCKSKITWQQEDGHSRW